ncbi:MULTISPECIES: hypothetical protein [Pseudoxanthomonas]|jgi:hypothetical protein|uniref:hypothetical protein n=1 Tax=Pseudoxanthomonas TaxID=83618 RepID=UPI0025837C15|nr:MULTISPECIES: hypothetical protein [Pseudoxanthomonas]MCH2091317.1 hypothetical protein [Pseudoxanthomonas sp.]
MRIKNYIFTATALTGMLVFAGCNKAPTAVDAEPPASAEAVPAAPEATVAAPVEAAPAVAIFYAQAGSALKDGVIAESLAEVPAAGPIYAMGVFKGTTDVDSKVGLVVTPAAGGEPVFQTEQSFRPAGEVPVVFELKPANGAFAPGDYKLVFSLDGAPCWELALKIK